MAPHDTEERELSVPELEAEMLVPRPIGGANDGGDRAFVGLIRFSGLLVLAVIAAIGIFLSWRGSQAIGKAGFGFLTIQDWQPGRNHFGIAGILTGTFLIAIVAVVIATPVALGMALFMSEVAPPWLRRILVSTVDLMAAVPSVVFAFWGKDYLQGGVIPISRWLSTWFGWIPIFHVDAADAANPLSSGTIYTASTFVVGVVVALMVLPIQCVVMRECFVQAPLGEREAAYALGATRWGMIRSVVLPFGRGGIIGGTMLGLGRALGETIVVLFIISPVFNIQTHLLQAGGNSVAGLIAQQYGEASSFGVSALMAAGLSLFVVTLLVNLTASAVIARSRSGAVSEV
jgi:phosphate transport system permease protein